MNIIMTQIKEEFEMQLQSILQNYPKPSRGIVQVSTSISQMNAFSRDYHSKAQAKISELAHKYPSIPLMSLKTSLMPLIVEYHCKLAGWGAFSLS